MKIKLLLIALNLFVFFFSFSQQPKYTFKKFVNQMDTTEFKIVYPKKDGFVRSYVIASPSILDIDDDSTTMIRGGVTALLCFEGELKDNQKEGIFKAYLIDSIDHQKRYKIWEQTFHEEKLNGEWRTYTLD